MILKTLNLSFIILLLYALLGSKIGFSFIQSWQTIELIMIFLVIIGLIITILGFNEIVLFYQKHLMVLNALGVTTVICLCILSGWYIYNENAQNVTEITYTIPSIALTISAGILILMLLVNFILMKHHEHI